MAGWAGECYRTLAADFELPGWQVSISWGYAYNGISTRQRAAVGHVFVRERAEWPGRLGGSPPTLFWQLQLQPALRKSPVACPLLHRARYGGLGRRGVV